MDRTRPLAPPGVVATLLGWPGDAPRIRLDHREFAYAGKFVTGRTGVAVAHPADATPTRGTAPGTGDGVGADGADRAGAGGDPDGAGADAGGTYAENVLAAVSFDADRTDPRTLVVRYVTVRRDRRGEGVGPALVDALAGWARERPPAGADDADPTPPGGYDRLRIAVNNPFAYEALYRAGFRFTGRESGLAELVLERRLGGDDGAGDPGTDPDPGCYRAGLARFADRELDDETRAFVREKREAGPPAGPGAGADDAGGSG